MSSTIQPDAGAEMSPEGLLKQRAGRRNFLKWTGASAAAVLLLGACDQEDTQSIVEVTPTPPTPPAPDPQNPSNAPAVALNLTTDVGILNFAYALEQLEAAFYTQVVANAAFNTNAFTDRDRRVLTDLRDHEVIHREFFRNAIPAASRIRDDLVPLFNTINFANRTSVLNAAQMFEDLGVGAYNGAGRFLNDAGFLTLAGKIVSVEARHASAIRDLISPKTGSFAPSDRDPALSPRDVLELANPFIQNPINPTYPAGV